MNDEEIIERVLNGEKDIFKEIIVRYERKVYEMAYGITLNREDTKDIVQESFLKAYVNLVKFRRNASFLTWLLKITYTTSMVFLRQKGKHGNTVKDDPIPVADGSGGVDNKIIMEKALKKLTDRERTVFLMHGRDGYKHREIGEILGIKEGTVKTLYFRAIDKLHSELEGKI